MMFIIYGVQTARQKSLVNRVSKRLYRSRPCISIFGDKTIVRIGSNAMDTSINPATTLRAGLNQLAFHRHLASLSSHQLIEEQVLAAINRDFIHVKEFTKRISEPNESSTDIELHSF
jgi:hypothetical protein